MLPVLLLPVASAVEKFLELLVSDFVSVDPIIPKKNFRQIFETGESQEVSWGSLKRRGSPPGEAVGLVNHSGRRFCFLIHRYRERTGRLDFSPRDHREALGGGETRQLELPLRIHERHPPLLDRRTADQLPCAVRLVVVPTKHGHAWRRGVDR